MEERYYDLVFIVRPATPEEEIKKVLTVIEHTVAEKGGKIEKTEHWGTRKLAYRVAKHREGIYVHQEIRTTHGELIAELERRLRVQGRRRHSIREPRCRRRVQRCHWSTDGSRLRGELHMPTRHRWCGQ